MPVERKPPCTRSRAHLKLEDPPLLGVVNHAVAPIHPPTHEEEEGASSLLQIDRSGLDYEDPDRYLTKCQEYLLQIPDSNKVSVLGKRLIGAAEKWWLCYKPMNLSFERFSDPLRVQFDSQSIKSAVVAKLYGTTQTDKERTRSFLQ
ncbi:hypothetical protein TKK_0018216 [Trichogramma kaykai]